MLYDDRSTRTTIPVTPDSEVAQWVQGRARTLARPLDAVEADGSARLVFAADELLVDGGDADLIAHLGERYGAEVVARRPVPALPDGLAPGRGVDVTDMPLPTRLRVTRAPAPTRRAAELLHAAFSGRLAASSERAARLLGVVAELAADGHDLGVNGLSTTNALPMLDPTDAAPQKPLLVPGYAGRARVGAAWQLVELFREFRPTRSVTVGILDAGFWLDGFTPALAPGQSVSDLGTPVAQMNLMDFGVSAGGASGMQATGGWTSPWHGNASASVATARVNNLQGAAGVGGTVARPVLLKTDGSLDGYFEALRVCLAWGVDVLNMSLGYSVDAEIWFPTKAWNHAFEWATAHGLLMVAAAGNDSARLPDDKNVRPATRTPGTITVGALDPPAPGTGAELPRSDSNFGSSVNVWAPSGIPVMPDDNNPMGYPFGGTSCAAPFVSGILAMMRAVAPEGTLPPERARRLLEDSGWRGTGRLGVGVDAYAAVLAAMGGAPPDGAAEAHATAATARPLQRGPGGALMPFRLPSDPRRDALTASTHANWYRFTLDTFAIVDLQLRFYPLLGAVSVTIEPEDDRAVVDLAVTGGAAQGFVRLQGLLPPGAHRVFVRGGLNLYELTIATTDAPPAPDQFEPNESFESATRFRLRDAPEGPLVAFTRDNPGGHFDLTLHAPNDRDVFRVEPVPTNPLNVPTLRITQTDAPVDVAVFDAARRPLTRQTGQRSVRLTLPRDQVSFVVVTGAHVTRYGMTLQLEVDPAHLPGPLENARVTPLPQLGDPPFRVEDGRTHVVFTGDALSRLGVLTLGETEGRALKVELLDGQGAVVRVAQRPPGGTDAAVALDVSGLAAGPHIVRIGHADPQAGATPLVVQRLLAVR